jgi:hypothetical protein
VKKNISFLLLLLISCFVWSQVIKAEKEHIISLIVGDGSGMIKFASTEEGLYSSGPPSVDKDGIIFFYPQLVDFIIEIKNRKMFTLDFPSDYSITSTPNLYPFVSQRGFYGYSFHPGEQEYQLQLNSSTKGVAGNIYYYMPWGIYCEYKGYEGEVGFGTVEYKPLLFSGLESVSKEYTFRDENKTRAWLPTQPGGFSIGDDGLLYRNGMIWSAVQVEPGYGTRHYLGKLMSGHNLWSGGVDSDSPSKYIISDSRGKVELIIEIPWGRDKATDPESSFRIYNYGIGPWGEIYALIAPSWKDGAEYYVPTPGESAELVVVRNHLKYFGRLNDGGVRLRKEPNTTSDILGTYPNKTGFRILEKGTKEEAIGGQKNVWYKVRLLDGTEGWFFGAFVHNLYDGPNGNPPPWPNVPDW